MNTYAIRGLLVCGLILMVAGCTHYYRVTDPGSGKTYYTTDIDKARGERSKLKMKGREALPPYSLRR